MKMKREELQRAIDILSRSTTSAVYVSCRPDETHEERRIMKEMEPIDLQLVKDVFQYVFQTRYGFEPMAAENRATGEVELSTDEVLEAIKADPIIVPAM